LVELDRMLAPSMFVPCSVYSVEVQQCRLSNAIAVGQLFCKQ